MTRISLARLQAPTLYYWCVISKSVLFLSTVLASAVYAGTPAIGIVTASGHVTVERSEVWGNSTLFDGATVETKSSSSDLALRNGVRVQLAAESRARIWQNHIALERGIGQMAAPASYELDAAGLRIRGASESPNETTRLRVTIGDRVEVMALAGAARVTNGAGLLLASIPAGRGMSFSQQAGATGAVMRTGCLLYKDSHFIFQDENTQEVAELSARDALLNDLKNNTGNRIEVTGTAGATKPVVSIATLLVNVSAITVKSQGGCLSAAAALNAQTEAPAGGPAPAPGQTPSVSTGGGGGGMSTGAKVAIIAAIAGGGAGAAIALAGHKSSTSP
jgi:hypothetical protein